MSKLINSLVLIVLLAAISSCSGGGGDDGGGGTRETAVRVLHGSIDASPVTLVQGGINLQTSRFAEPRDYIPVEPVGLTSFAVERANSPGNLIASLGPVLEKKTEYSVLVTGSSADSTLSAAWLVDQTDRPDPGLALVRVVNSVSGVSRVSASFGASPMLSAASGSGSDYAEVPSGLTSVRVFDANRNLILSRNINIADRSELTLLVTGDRELNVYFATEFVDYD